MKRGGSLKRTKPMARGSSVLKSGTPPKRAGCGKRRYRDELAAKLALADIDRKDRAAKGERRAYKCPACVGWHLTSQPRTGADPQGRRKTRRETGFTAATKLLIRTRAGQGDPDAACCEACGRWLGRHGGECQHIQARQMGGSRRRNKPSNGTLLCGPVADKATCHGRCEARSEHMRAQGFWLLSSDPPGPIMLHGEQGGVTVWLSDDGRYLFTPPQERVA